MGKKKRFPPGRCVHCGEHTDDPTVDHVFPEAWYPDTTAAGLEKWKMPACRPCNALHGENERELLVRFGLCLDPADSATRRIVEKAQRAIDPSHATNDRDRGARIALRDKIRSEALYMDAERVQLHRESLVPGFDDTSGRTRDEIGGINLPHEALRMLAEKIMRGIFFIDGRRMLDDRRAHVWLFRAPPDGIVDLLSRFGAEYAREPGIRVVRAVPVDDAASCLFRIEIWNKLTIYGAILTNDRLRSLGVDDE